MFTDTTIPDLGGRLRHARETAGFTREYVAVQIGRSVAAVRDWEQNQRAPRMVLLAQLAQLYQVPLTDLVVTEVPAPMTPEVYATVAAMRSVRGLPPAPKTAPAVIAASRDPTVQRIAAAAKREVDRSPPLSAEQIEQLRGLLPYPHPREPTAERTPA